MVKTSLFILSTLLLQAALVRPAHAQSGDLPAGHQGPLTLDETNRREQRRVHDEQTARQASDSQMKTRINSRDVVPETSKDECTYSSEVDRKYRCKATKGIIEGAQVTNQVLQVGGSVATQVQGQKIQNNIQQNGFQQSEVLKATGKMQVKAGNTQMTIGAINSAVGVVQVAKALQHQRYFKEFEQQVKTVSGATFNTSHAPGCDPINANCCPTDKDFAPRGNPIASKILADEKFSGAISSFLAENISNCDRQRLNIANQYISMPPAVRSAAFDAFYTPWEKNVREQLAVAVKRVASSAADEQSEVATAAALGGFTSLQTGGAMILNGATNKKAGKMQQKLADSYIQAQNSMGLPPLLDQFQPPTVPNQNGVITGSGDSNTLEASAEKNEDSNDMAAPTNPLPSLKDYVPAPPATPFVRGLQNPPGGGGGVPGLSPGSTSVDNGGNRDEPQARLAEGSKVNASAYAAGGVMAQNRGGSAGNNAGGSAGGGSGNLLGDLMDKMFKDKQQEGGQTSILDMGKGGLRAPANAPEEEAGFSVLDRSANLFDRIHETYQTKHRQGNIGI